MKSRSRKGPFDIVVYYVHGGDFAGCSLAFYYEYLGLLVRCLLDRGFQNPAIYAINYSSSCLSDATFNTQLSEVANAWNELCLDQKNAVKVICGDSNGATLLLALLLHIARPSQDIAVKCHQVPQAAILVSPITHLLTPKMPVKSDYLTPHALEAYAKKCVERTSIHDVYHSPGLCRSKEWWLKALPSVGTTLIFGDSEMLAPDIFEFYRTIKNCGKVTLETEENQIHSWPYVMCCIGQSQKRRESGVALIANYIGDMLLWDVQTNSFY